jgi:hypothetical protein
MGSLAKSLDGLEMRGNWFDKEKHATFETLSL